MTSRTGQQPARPPIADRPAMAEYGVPSTPDGLLDWSWASSRLTTCRNFWVVTVTRPPNIAPHAMPVWGVWLEETQRFWFGCARTSRKHHNLQANPNVTFASSDTVEVVSVEGTAMLVDNPSDTDATAAKIAVANKYAELDKRDEMIEFYGASALWMVTPKRAFGIIEREDEFGARATRWTWAS